MAISKQEDFTNKGEVPRKDVGTGPDYLDTRLKDINQFASYFYEVGSGGFHNQVKEGKVPRKGEIGEQGTLVNAVYNGGGVMNSKPSEIITPGACPGILGYRFDWYSYDGDMLAEKISDSWDNTAQQLHIRFKVTLGPGANHPQIVRMHAQVTGGSTTNIFHNTNYKTFGLNYGQKTFEPAKTTITLGIVSVFATTGTVYLQGTTGNIGDTFIIHPGASVTFDIVASGPWPEDQNVYTLFLSNENMGAHVNQFASLSYPFEITPVDPNEVPPSSCGIPSLWFDIDYISTKMWVNCEGYFIHLQLVPIGSISGTPWVQWSQNYIVKVKDFPFYPGPGYAHSLYYSWTSCGSPNGFASIAHNGLSAGTAFGQWISNTPGQPGPGTITIQAQWDYSGYIDTGGVFSSYFQVVSFGTHLFYGWFYPGWNDVALGKAGLQMGGSYSGKLEGTTLPSLLNSDYLYLEEALIPTG